MEGYGPPTYGDRIAGVYDRWYEDRFNITQTVDLLAELAGQGRVLELAIGTGRIAIPLAARGVEVVGIDASESMVAKLRAKPGGDKIPVVMGDFAEVAAEGTFALIFVAFTTFFALGSQAEQIRCLHNVVAHLDGDGWFVMDAFVPDHSRFWNDQRVSVEQIDVSSVVLDASRHDPVEQRVDASHVVLTDRGVQLYPVSLRYAWPAELDAMAMVAGLGLAHRWGDYDRSAFTASSGRHVSVYRKSTSP